MKKTVSIIGGGAAAIALAAFMNEEKFDVTIFEKNKTLGRKFLVAGKGGFNLTHSEPLEVLIDRYSPPPFLKAALLSFNNIDFRDWLASIGIPTYVGTSKRVYPKEGIKPIEVLNAIQAVLEKKKVKIEYNKTWTGWKSDHQLEFDDGVVVEADYNIFALGGGSWKVTGSDGAWWSVFENSKIDVVTFQSSNCAYKIGWGNDFKTKYAGAPLKNIAISCLDKTQKGEVVITEFGLEGNAIYALSPEIRSGLNRQKKAIISIDLKPTMTLEDIITKLKGSTSKNTTQLLKDKLKLSQVQIGLLKAFVSKEAFLDTYSLALNIKGLTLTIVDAANLDEAISTVGGVSISEVDANYQLNSIKNSFCIGEMLDWDAPTGGYLLQACFSMGAALAIHLNTKD